jgi:hypothetical protein
MLLKGRSQKGKWTTCASLGMLFKGRLQKGKWTGEEDELERVDELKMVKNAYVTIQQIRDLNP